MAHLVVNIRYVHYKLDIEFEVVTQYAPNDVCGDIVASVAKVGIVVYSRTAHIPRNVLLLSIDGYERGFSPCKGVIDLQWR